MHRQPPASAFASFIVGALALSLLSIVGAGRAIAAEDSIAVLGIDAIEVGDALGTQLTDALRRHAAEAGVDLVPGKDLVELKMVFNCDGEAPACLAQAGRSLGADRLIYGTAKKAEGGRAVAISLKLLDVRDSAVIRQVTETLPKKSLGPAAISAAATRWFGQLVVPAATGSVLVQSQPSDVQVTIDGSPVGRTPYRAKDLKPRSYSVTLSAEGYHSVTRTVEVRAGSNESLTLRLDRVEAPKPPKPPTVGVVEPIQPPIIAEPTKPRHPGRPAKYAAIGLVAGAVVAGAVAIYTWRTYLSLENEANQSLRALAPPTGTAEQRVFYGDPSCKTPPGAAGPEATSYVSNCDSGKKYAGATTGLWVTAGVLAAAGVVSFIVGERMDSKAERERTTGQSIRQSLRLVPALSTKGGGLSASFEF